MKKTLVLDTNVILHDSDCIYHFEDNDIVLPMAVLEELDHFKKGNDVLNYHARAFVRAIDKLSTEKMFEKGVKLGAKQGVFRVEINSTSEELAGVFSEDITDHRILYTAYELSKAQKQRVVLVSKDVNLRMKAKALGLEAQDYFTDKVASVDELYTGKSIREHVDTEIIDTLYKTPFELPFDQTGIEDTPAPWHHYILKNAQKSALAVYNPTQNLMQRLDKRAAHGIIPRNAEQLFALDILTNDEIPLVSITGKAGTGKTLLALAAAMEKKRSYRQIYIARPIVPLSNKDIGYLPGDIQSKIDPYLQPLWDNLKVIQNQYLNDNSEFEKINKLVEEEKIVIAPLTYIRGRSLQKIFFIVDEAQNLTPHEIKTIITRAGEGTKVVFTGDVFQIDHPFLDSQSNGLSYLIDRFKGQRLYAHMNLEKGERSALAELASNLL
ncbi:MAG: PhoH family protein [Candidatus Marinimicrobia bacterium]|jgi:PhoH-like ATPase|nr:PhoH family protein [Candidatus Neomarinimicrobiota bacterium]MBT3631050.1 PhoH family protein [Candidatus Neomarinimicrobiota bacterium]MBT3825690.1 PhoH family protein [Candidatus Neomarinimicrobiota bacterium]MBT4130566.1 PhoH family protein [Candidatus Neomarinimicrobiota bacterium]MBT4296213.1 PhoH family protein [Candidatus Neomarinimicrobiota bacterium]